jgi:hypothetical protein
MKNLLWRNRGFLFRWGLFAITLIGLGWFLHVLLPPEPRWTMVTRPMKVLASNDNQLIRYGHHGDEQSASSLQFLDLARGREVHRMITDGADFRESGQSKCERFFVGLVKSDKPEVERIRWVDLKERREWNVRVRLEKFESALFSPGCDVVALRQRQVGVPDAAYALVDTSTGRMLDRFQIPVVAPADPNDLGDWNASPPDGTFTRDGSTFAVTYTTNGTQHIRLVNTRTGKAMILDNARLLSLSKDSRCLVAERTGARAWIWDLALQKWRCRIEGDIAPVITFSPDNRLIAFAEHESKKVTPIRFIDAQTGKSHWQFHFTDRRWLPGRPPSEYEAFSPDSRLFLMTAQPQSWRLRLILCDVQKKLRLWERTWRDDWGCEPLFTPDSRTVIAAFADAGRVEILDAETGQSRFTIPLGRSTELAADLTGDGRTLVVAQRGPMGSSFWGELRERFFAPEFEQPCIFNVYDVETGRELGGLRTEQPLMWGTSKDRRSLVLFYGNGGHTSPSTSTTIHCWDIPPGKPLRWVLGVPLGIGLVGLMGAAWRRRRRTLRLSAENGCANGTNDAAPLVPSIQTPLPKG